METVIRKPFQGVLNIILFNSRMYGWALGFVAIFIVLKSYLDVNQKLFCDLFILLISTSIFISIVVSFYIYDYSDLYKMKWLSKINILSNAEIANISAGFDETSELLKQKLTPSKIVMFDFYDETKHTEQSIKLAREFYPPSNDLIKTSTGDFLTEANNFDYIFLILAAHEIRNNNERTLFFKQLNKALNKNGRIIVVEHQRNLANFIVYNIGFFHFLSNNTWLQTFTSADCTVEQKFNITPFIKTYILKSNGNSF